MGKLKILAIVLRANPANEVNDAGPSCVRNGRWHERRISRRRNSPGAVDSAAIEDEAMMTVNVPRTTIEKIARSVLARNGISGIWQLHVAAADAHRMGHPQSEGIEL